MIKHQRNLPSPQTAARVITLSGISLKQHEIVFSPSKATFIVALRRLYHDQDASNLQTLLHPPLIP